MANYLADAKWVAKIRRFGNLAKSIIGFRASAFDHCPWIIGFRALPPDQRFSSIAPGSTAFEHCPRINGSRS
jgi:hypothetical protein